MKNVWTTDLYIFQATSSGVDVYDTTTQTITARAPWASGVGSVWASDTYLYFGTTNSGVQSVAITSISGTYDLSGAISTYKTYPEITGKNVRYLHGEGDYVCLTTVSGVDHIKISTDDRIYTTTTTATKCFQTSTGEFYYIDDTLYAVYDNSNDWGPTSSGVYEYDKGDDYTIYDEIINDMYIVEGASFPVAPNLIFLATTSGTILIEENRGDEDAARFKYFLTEG